MWIRSQDKKTLVKVDKLIIGYDKSYNWLININHVCSIKVPFKITK